MSNLRETNTLEEALEEALEDALERFRCGLIDLIMKREPVAKLISYLPSDAKLDEPLKTGLRPLHYAAFHNYVEGAKLFLDRGCDVNSKNDSGYTALHIASSEGYLELIKLLVENKAQVRFNEFIIQEPSNTLTYAEIKEEPLRLALQFHHYDCAEFLLQSGADPNARYHFGTEMSFISATDARGLELLLKYGANANSRDRGGITPLMRACRDYDGYEAAKVLIKYNADVNAVSKEISDYRSVLHFAVLSTNIGIVRLLIRHGANVRFIFPKFSMQKQTPLDFAILNGDMAIAKLLIDAGADVNVGSSYHGLPLHLVVGEKVRDKAEFIDVLIRAGANPNAIMMHLDIPLSQSPIGEYFNCLQRRDIRIVRQLLKYGARVIIKHQSQDPLGIMMVLKFLDLDRDRDVLDLLMEAAESFSIETIKKSRQFLEEKREYLLNHATSPPTLLHLSRLSVRKILLESAIQSQKNLANKHKPQQQSSSSTSTTSASTSSAGSVIKREAGAVERAENEIPPLRGEFSSILDEETLARVNRMTLSEIQKEFTSGLNNDVTRLNLIGALLYRTSLMPLVDPSPNLEVLERINQLPLSGTMKEYLKYEISFHRSNYNTTQPE